MHRITFGSILLLSATAADAAWYQKNDGTIVDPIRDRFNNPHPYSGVNLEPHAYLPGADLSGAKLTSARGCPAQTCPTRT